MRYLILILVLFCSCNTNKIVLKNKLDLAKKCAELFPTQTRYVQGDSVILYDTIERVEVQKCIDIITKDTIKLKCKDIIKYVYRVDTFVKTDSAYVYVIQSEIRTISSKLNKEIESKKTWRKWALILGGLVTSFLVFKGIKLYLKTKL